MQTSELTDQENSYIPFVEEDMKDYPPTLQAKHIADYLGVGVGTVYKLMKSGEMPVASVPNSKFLLVPKRLFVLWYAESLKAGDSGLDGGSN